MARSAPSGSSIRPTARTTSIARSRPPATFSNGSWPRSIRNGSTSRGWWRPRSFSAGPSLREPSRDWKIGPLGHALHALNIYQERAWGVVLPGGIAAFHGPMKAADAADRDRRAAGRRRADPPLGSGSLNARPGRRTLPSRRSAARPRRATGRAAGHRVPPADGRPACGADDVPRRCELRSSSSSSTRPCGSTNRRPPRRSCVLVDERLDWALAAGSDRRGAAARGRRRRSGSRRCRGAWSPAGDARRGRPAGPRAARPGAAGVRGRRADRAGGADGGGLQRLRGGHDRLGQPAATGGASRPAHRSRSAKPRDEGAAGDPQAGRRSGPRDRPRGPRGQAGRHAVRGRRHPQGDAGESLGGLRSRSRATAGRNGG